MFKYKTINLDKNKYIQLILLNQILKFFKNKIIQYEKLIDTFYKKKNKKMYILSN